jgi:phosphoribosyl-AMP cyclohydrolase
MIDTLKYNQDGLIPAIVQDAGDGRVLMMAWMNAESLGKTLETGVMHYWSRSRQKLWLKGETSGHTQKVERCFADCDADTLLFQVRQEGGACHTGYRSCFFREFAPDGSTRPVIEERIFDPAAKYGA